MNMKRIISLCLITVFFMGVAVPVYAEPENKELADTQAKYDEYMKETEKQEAELHKIDAKIEPLLETIEKNKAEVEKLNKEIKELEKEIESSKGKIEEKEVVLGKRLRELYKSGGQISYLTVFFGAGSLSELLDRLSTTDRILSIDKNVISDLAEGQKELKTRIDALEKKKTDINRLSTETERKIKEVEKEKEEARNILKEMEEKTAKLDSDVLAKLELDLVSPQMSIIDNEDSSYSDIEGAIAQLQSIRDNQLKSPTTIGQVNSYIDKGTSILETIDSQNNTAAKGEQVVNIAYGYLGYPYVWGATGPGSFDCSGFTSYVYRQMGVEITRSTYSQIGQGIAVSYDELMPGDLVFLNNNTHVGIYVGNGQYIHAANENLGVIVSGVTGFYAARRIFY